MTAFRSGCPIASSLDLVGDRWSLVILRSMAMGARSYSALLAEPEKIATNILADRLRRLQQAGLIVMEEAGAGSRRGVIGFTPAGAALLPVIQALARWGETFLPDRWTAPDRFYAMRPETL